MNLDDVKRLNEQIGELEKLRKSLTWYSWHNKLEVSVQNMDMVNAHINTIDALIIKLIDANINDIAF